MPTIFPLLLLLGTTITLLLDSAKAACAPEYRRPKFSHKMCAIVRPSAHGRPFVADLPDSAAKKFKCTKPCADIHSPIREMANVLERGTVWEMGEAWRCETEVGKWCIVMTKLVPCGYEWYLEGDCDEVEVWEEEEDAPTECDDQIGRDGADRNGKPNTICYPGGTNAKVTKRFEMPPPLMDCIPAGFLMNAEKKGKFEAEQANGAFLEDYIDPMMVPAATSGAGQQLRPLLDCLTAVDVPGNVQKCQEIAKNFDQQKFVEALFEAADEDRDGALTAEEVKKFVEGEIEPYLLARYSSRLPPGPIGDRNRDQLKVIVKEQAERMAQMAIKSGDKNGDGKLDKAEVAAGLKAPNSPGIMKMNE